ncbi:MAG: hypothetical protein KDE51_01650 [Anaerolineales bacterium]|nr:hypothetical protein [Anaerolineales bacterium]
MTTINTQSEKHLERNQWIQLGVITAVASVVAVLIVQALAIAIWPDIVLFKPLDSYVRTAVFTAVPAVGATVLFAWLDRHKPQPVKTFINIAAVVLILSIIPDYLIPVVHKTFLASTVTAFLHVVAAIVTVFALVIGYRRQMS